MELKERLKSFLKANDVVKIWYCDEEWVGPEYLLAVSDHCIMTVYRKNELDFTENTEVNIHPLDDNIYFTEDEALKHFAKTHDGEVYRLKDCHSDEETWWYGLEEGDEERIVEVKSLEDLL